MPAIVITQMSALLKTKSMRATTALPLPGASIALVAKRNQIVGGHG